MRSILWECCDLTSASSGMSSVQSEDERQPVSLHHITLQLRAILTRLTDSELVIKPYL